jgi:hypothetical protein
MFNQEEQAKWESRVPKPADVLRGIRALESIDLKLMPDYALRTLLNGYFPVFGYSSGTIPAGTLLFRARPNKDPRFWDKVSDIHYPKPDYVRSYGRANSPGKPIFYCSSSLHQTAFETLQNLKYSTSLEREIGQITVGVYEVKSPLHVAMIIDSPVLHGIRNDIRSAHEEAQAVLSKNNQLADTTIAQNLISQFFAEQFTKSDIQTPDDYKISVQYTNAIREMNKAMAPEYHSERFDGINYPSVAMKYMGDNQALFIESVDSKIEFVNALQVFCSHFDFDEAVVRTSILREAQSVQGDNIIWKNELYSGS